MNLLVIISVLTHKYISESHSWIMSSFEDKDGERVAAVLLKGNKLSLVNEALISDLEDSWWGGALDFKCYQSGSKCDLLGLKC